MNDNDRPNDSNQPWDGMERRRPGEGAMFLDMRRHVMYWNSGAREITGYGPDEALDTPCCNLLAHADASGEALCEDRCPAAMTLNDGQARQLEVTIRHRMGHRVPVQAAIRPVRDGNGKLIGCSQLFTEAPSLQSADKKLRRLESLVMRDSLTGLANRRHLEMLLQARLSGRHDHAPFGVILADVDHLQSVNEQFGRPVGDKILRMIGRTIAGSCRIFDAVGRWNALEFLAVATLKNGSDLYTISERVRSLVEQSFLIHEESVVGATISLGAACCCKGDTLQTLIDRATMLLRTSKARGRNTVST